MEIFDRNLAAEFAGDAAVPPEHISGVRCDVVNCAYHDGERFCTADCINVGSHMAADKGETSCRTFERRMSAAN